jgi:hypothetical protein
MILSYPDTLVAAVADEPPLALRRVLGTVLKPADVKRIGTEKWFDVTGRRVPAQTAGAGTLGPGVYVAPGAGRGATKLIVVR